jgi:hypothetical protein
MGIDSSVYLGPFIRVPGVQKESKNTKVRCSRGCSRTPASDAKFCMDCGAPVSTVTNGKVELQKLYPSHVGSGNYEDDFWCPEYCSGDTKYEAIWIPNFKCGITWHEHDDCGATTVNVVSADEVASFTAKHATLLAAIADEYGVQAQVCWGFVPYAS